MTFRQNHSISRAIAPVFIDFIKNLVNTNSVNTMIKNTFTIIDINLTVYTSQTVFTVATVFVEFFDAKPTVLTWIRVTFVCLELAIVPVVAVTHAFACILVFAVGACSSTARVT